MRLILLITLTHALTFFIVH